MDLFLWDLRGHCELRSSYIPGWNPGNPGCTRAQGFRLCFATCRTMLSQKGDSEGNFEAGLDAEANVVRRDGGEKRQNCSELNALRFMERDLWVT